MRRSLERLRQVAFVLRRDPRKLFGYGTAVARRVARRLRRSLTQRRPRSTLRAVVAATGKELDEWVCGASFADAVYVGASEAAIKSVEDFDLDRIESTRRAADRILNHEFRLLSPDPWHSRDPIRPSRNDYEPLDWFLDPVSGLRFPEGIAHDEWDLYAMRPGLADIKLPWELARCQHWATLGQAYRLVGDDRYAREIVHQLDDFLEANPLGIGINWTCTMDVALRAANWVIGLALIDRSDVLDVRVKTRALDALFDHGVFIFDNLENVHEVTSNHFLTNVVGLYFVAGLFPDLPQGRQWSSFCRQSLQEEIQVQVLDDGADFESSIPYHRLVTELFLGAARLASFRGEPLSEVFQSQLRAMVEYLAGVLRPDGLMPQVGDADDGRLHILSDYGTWEPQDPRHLFGPAGAFFETDDWAAFSSSNSRWEAAWWGYEAAGRAQGPFVPPSHFRLYPDAGIVVARASGNYLLVTNGCVGTEGFGNHKHNDLLGFEYHVGGAPVLVDPGSYVYTSNPDERNRFRGTGFHNTVQVDGLEQNEFRSEWLFRMFERALPSHESFDVDEPILRYAGSHGGFNNGEVGLRHRREFSFDSDTGALSIADCLEGHGEYSLRWHFHCAPGVDVDRDEAGQLVLGVGSSTRIRFNVSGDLLTKVAESWYSEAYGVRVPCRAIDFALEVKIDGELKRTFLLQPDG